MSFGDMKKEQEAFNHPSVVSMQEFYNARIEQLENQLKETQEKLDIAIDTLEFFDEESADIEWCERYLPIDDRDFVSIICGDKARETLEKLRKK